MGIPKMEDSYVKGDNMLQERASSLGIEIAKFHDVLAVDRCKNFSSFDRLEGKMRELQLEFEDKIARSQRSLQQQMEYVSRLVITRGDDLVAKAHLDSGSASLMAGGG